MWLTIRPKSSIVASRDSRVNGSSMRGSHEWNSLSMAAGSFLLMAARSLRGRLVATTPVPSILRRFSSS